MLWVGCSSGEADGPAPASEEAAAEASPPAAPQKLMPAPPTGAPSVEARLDDATLVAQVKMALVDERSLRAFEVEPAAQGRRVTLYGDVNTRAQYDRAAEIARGVDGVATVANELTVEGRRVTAEASGAASSAPSGAASSGGSGVYHTVRSGESLWIIARRNGTSPGEIRQLNGLSSNTVKPGQRLLVRRTTGTASATASSEASPSAPPSAEKTAESSSASYHTVRSGESLWIIARRNGTSVDEIRRLNDLRSNTVKPGQRLRVD